MGCEGSSIINSRLKSKNIEKQGGKCEKREVLWVVKSKMSHSQKKLKERNPHHPLVTHFYAFHFWVFWHSPPASLFLIITSLSPLHCLLSFYLPCKFLLSRTVEPNKWICIQNWIENNIKPLTKRKKILNQKFWQN